MVPELRYKMLFICLSLSFFFCSWFWHIRLHETFCGWWAIFFLELFFHVPIAVLTVLLMRYCVAVIGKLSGNMEKKSVLKFSKLKYLMFGVVAVVMAAVALLIGHFLLPSHVPEAPPAPCPRMEGCPAAPCEIPIVCVDAFCPSLTNTCGTLQTAKTSAECYASNATYPDAYIAECSPSPFITTVAQCNAVVASPPPVDPSTFVCNKENAESLMSTVTGQNFTFPKILKSCDESFEFELCLFCSSYRNMDTTDLVCASHLDSDQLIFDDRNTAQSVTQWFFDILDAVIFGISFCFLLVVIPIIWKSDIAVKFWTKVKMYLFAFAVFWNSASWFFHGRVHGYVVKPMAASTSIVIEVSFHFTVMISSAIIAWCLYDIIDAAHQYSLSPYRTSQSTDQFAQKGALNSSTSPGFQSSRNNIKDPQSMVEVSTFANSTVIEEDNEKADDIL
eukprot:Awhi_evm1s13205